MRIVRRATKLPTTRRNKFNATKAYAIDGTQTDSKIEARYYDHLLSAGVDFKYQQAFEIVPAVTIDGKRHGARKYRPDFCIYEGDKLVKVVDVKGGKATITADSSLRMAAFMARYEIPVTIAVYDARTGLFIGKLR